ncbi:MAG: hypothetical protein Q9224_003469 [Gallowayella concinna]
MNSDISSSANKSNDSTIVEQLLQDTISVTTIAPTGKPAEAQQAMLQEDSQTSQTSQRERTPESETPDSLRWFGILVPPALRATQTSFKHAVTEAIPSLANLSNEMKSMEIEIRRMRKKIKKIDQNEHSR